MIRQPAFAVEPWTVREATLDLDRIAQSESVFALSNGHIGLRGNLDEGEPFGLPGTYLNGYYEGRPLPYAEAGFGYPESGQSVVNATNGKLIRLLVEDEPFDVRYGELRHHERVLDLREGTLSREVEWVSPVGQAVKVRSVRLVSLAQRAIAAIQYEVEPIGGRARVVLQSELVANEPIPHSEGDPRATAALEAPLVSELAAARDLRSVLVHVTRRSGLRMAAGFEHLIEGPDDIATAVQAEEDLARLTLTTEIAPGQPLRLTKFIAYGWSSVRSTPAVRDQVSGALAEAKHTGWDSLRQLQKRFLDGFWKRADVEIEGDPELQQALRFGMFHVLQAGARVEGRAIPAKGLTGSGYDGHAFWDTETFVLPMLTYSLPEAARDALRWRHSTLDQARRRAAQLGLEGAAFPWRTIDGDECSGYWPAGTAAFHVTGDVADSCSRYLEATEDEDFARQCGTELLVETARLWRSLGHHDKAGRFRIDGVTGPDEYSAIADNNVYTNLIAQRNLRDAAAATESDPELAGGFGVDSEEAAGWRDAAEAMIVPYDEDLGVHAQSESYTEHAVWDFDATASDHHPLFLHYPYFDLYRKQVVKQADLVLALHLRGDAFTAEEKARDFAYYEALTVRDSSLSACTQAVIAAEVGQLDLAFAYMTEAALMDLDDLEQNSRDGVHMASLAGAWIAAVAGFGGMRDHGGHLTFTPRLPENLTRLRFRLAFRHRLIEVEVGASAATYTLLDGDPLEVAHHGESLTLKTDRATSKPIPHLDDPGPRPQQPPGRAPRITRGPG
ncbi:MAG: family 65 glycosyl hydrolase [Solirubrobacterales bacterium]|nr:family 65 glycosyl hydrolase [Solirubrobacterales bacterium]